MSFKQSFQNNYPFLTCIKSSDVEYVGIIINLDNNVASIYDFTSIRTNEEKEKFLDLGDVWWWESNRKIPINIFLKKDMIPFRQYIKTFNPKDVKVIFGPTINLSDISQKRVKRKSIQLVRTIKKIRRI